MQLIEQYKKVVLENYANFNGRARRSEFWWYTLANIIISIPLAIIDNTLGLESFGIGSVYSLAVLIPGIAVAVRRLHDIGKSGWMLLIIFIPLIGAIWLIVLYATEGDSGSNEYGEDPKGGVELDSFGKQEVLEN